MRGEGALGLRWLSVRLAGLAGADASGGAPGRRPLCYRRPSWRAEEKATWRIESGGLFPSCARAKHLCMRFSARPRFAPNEACANIGVSMLPVNIRRRRATTARSPPPDPGRSDATRRLRPLVSRLGSELRMMPMDGTLLEKRLHCNFVAPPRTEWLMAL